MKQYDVKLGTWSLLSQGNSSSIGIKREINRAQEEAKYRKHNHEDTGLSEAFYLLDGKAVLHVNETKIVLEKSKIVVVEPHEEHQLVKPANSHMDILVIAFKEIKI